MATNTAFGSHVQWNADRIALVDPVSGLALAAPINFQPRIQSVHDVGLAEPLHELVLPSPYGVGTATSAGKYEFAYGTPVYCARGFNGYKFWMVAAPYPTQGVDLDGLAASKYENPTILASNDGENFEVPAGVSNPIFSSIGLADVNSYYADPYITFNADYSKLYVIFMHTTQSGTIKSSLLVTESSDGITWTTPVHIFDSTSTGMTANSPSLFWNGDGWTCIVIDTLNGTGTYLPKIMTTAEETPYTGWSAFSTSTWTHPLGRTWWHSHFIPMDDGGIIGMAVDNTSAGGTVYSLQSHDGGVNFSVRPFSAWGTTTPGGQWYRPSLCLCSDGVNQTLIGYFSRVGAIQQPGYFVQKAKLIPGETDRQIANANIEDMINRQPTVPASLLTNILPAFDSFNRTDDALALGTSDGGLAWTNKTGTYGIGTNRAYNSTAAFGNSIATMDPGLQNFEFSAVIETLGVGGQVYLVFNFQDNSNFWRFGWLGSASQYKLQKIVAGAAVVDRTPVPMTCLAGDRLTVRRQGKYITIFHNGRPIDTYYDSAFSAKTLLGFQAASETTYIGQMYVKAL